MKLQLSRFQCSIWMSSQNVLERIQPLTPCAKQAQVFPAPGAIRWVPESFFTLYFHPVIEGVGVEIAKVFFFFVLHLVLATTTRLFASA